MSKRIVQLDDLSKLAKLQCTKTEAAAGLGISLKQFNELLKTHEQFKVTWEAGFEEGKVSLRRKQFNLASSSAPMAIFLGKQWLHQEDVSKQEHDHKVDFDASNLDKDERARLRELISEGTARQSGQS